MSRRDRDHERHRERETRESDTKRRRSGFDQLPPSLDGAGERPRKEPESESVPVDHGRSPRGFHDALPPPPPLPESGKPEPEKEAGRRGGEEEEKKKEAANGRGNGEARRRNEDPARPPRSRTLSQHDDRGNAWQADRSFGRRASSDRQWRDSKDDRSDRRMNSYATNDLKRKDEKYSAKRDGHSSWRHDGFFRMEAEHPPPPRKRPAFREQKMRLDSENADTPVAEPSRSVTAGKERAERDRNEPRPVDKSENLAPWGRRDVHRTGFSSRQRYNSGNDNYRGRESFDGVQGYRPTGTQGDKWKHDLFEEANKSPASKNEEDKIAKLEQLLSS